MQFEPTEVKETLGLCGLLRVVADACEISIAEAGRKAIADDRFNRLEKLGEGGMGVVYKAHDTHLDRFAALKVITPDRVTDEERKRRFIQEARAASALNHPNIVTIYDIATDQGTTFIAMEFVAGKSLAEVIPRHGLPLAQVLNYAVQIADGLARAHQAGIIHRDLKPGNIMIGDDGRARILDFGLAKLADPSHWTLADRVGRSRWWSAASSRAGPDGDRPPVCDHRSRHLLPQPIRGSQVRHASSPAARRR